MLLTIEPLPSERGLRLAGEADMSNADELERALSPLVESGGDVVLDCSGLIFMDSAGFRVLIQAAQELGDGGRLLLRSPRTAIQRALTLLGLSGLPSLEVLERANQEGRMQRLDE